MTIYPSTRHHIGFWEGSSWWSPSQGDTAGYPSVLESHSDLLARARGSPRATFGTRWPDDVHVVACQCASWRPCIRVGAAEDDRLLVGHVLLGTRPRAPTQHGDPSTRSPFRISVAGTPRLGGRSSTSTQPNAFLSSATSMRVPGGDARLVGRGDVLARSTTHIHPASTRPYPADNPRVPDRQDARTQQMCASIRPRKLPSSADDADLPSGDAHLPGRQDASCRRAQAGTRKMR
jgi:hypothetical protein